MAWRWVNFFFWVNYSFKAQILLSISGFPSKIWSMTLLLRAVYLHYNWGQNTTLLNTFCVLLNLSPVINDLTVSLWKITHKERKRQRERERERERGGVLLLLFFCYYVVIKLLCTPKVCSRIFETSESEYTFWCLWLLFSIEDIRMDFRDFCFCMSNPRSLVISSADCFPCN